MTQSAEYVLAIVQWEDTTNMAAWLDPAEVEDFAINERWFCENVGWVTVDNEDCIVLSARRTTDNEHLGLSERIPRGAILSIRYVQWDGSMEECMCVPGTHDPGEHKRRQSWAGVTHGSTATTHSDGSPDGGS